MAFKQSAKIFFGMLMVSLCWHTCALALKANYAEVLVENLRIGNSYNLTQLLNMPLTIGNKMTKPVKIGIQVEQPDKQNLKKGFEAIPDVKWVNIEPKNAEVPAQGNYLADIKITIPSDEKYLGGKFQVAIHSMEIPEGPGLVVGFGVYSRLLFTVAPVKMALQTAPPPISLDFSLVPERVIVTDMVLGVKHELLNEEKKPIELVNKQDRKLSVQLAGLNTADFPLAIEKGYEPAPNPDFISFPKDELVLGPKSRKPVRLFINIPDEKQYQGRHYLFLVAFRTGEVTSGQQLLRVFVSTAGGAPAETPVPGALESKPEVPKDVKP